MGVADFSEGPGSGSRADTVSQFLAGRTALLNLLPLSYGEILRFGDHEDTLDEVLLIGGCPRIYDRGLGASEWLGSYIATYLERDVRSVRNVGDLDAFGRFLRLCAGRTAQLVNHSALAADCGVSQPTAKASLAMLDVSFVAMSLPAFWANLRKRLVKQPKLQHRGHRREQHRSPSRDPTPASCWGSKRLKGLRRPVDPVHAWLVKTTGWRSSRGGCGLA